MQKKRTPYGKQMLGRIRVFKRFLETAQKQRLEALVMGDPQYFYNILPYTYVLGISSKWISKFESIVIPPPNWYGGNSVYVVSSFGAFMDSTMAQATATMASSSSSSSGDSSGGSSGGGSSGGGSGGGGGGSW